MLSPQNQPGGFSLTRVGRLALFEVVAVVMVPSHLAVVCAQFMVSRGVLGVLGLRGWAGRCQGGGRAAALAVCPRAVPCFRR